MSALGRERMLVDAAGIGYCVLEIPVSLEFLSVPGIP